MSKSMIVAGVDLADNAGKSEAKWHKILHTDRDVIDKHTGAVLITAEQAPVVAAEMVKGFEAQMAAGMVVPVDLDHAIDRVDGGAPKTYGVTTAVDLRDDGLYAQFKWNSNGEQWIGKDHEGTAQISPSIRGKLYTTDADEPASLQHLRANSLTLMPRQSGLGIVELSEQATEVDLTEVTSRDEMERFDQAMKRAAEAQLRIEGFAVEWAWVTNWQGADSGTLVVSWSTSDGGAYTDHMRRLDWARDGRIVTVTGPSVAVERVSEFQEVSEESQNPAPTSVQMSDTPRQQEDPMPGENKGLEIALSEMGEHRAVVEVALSEAKAATTKVTGERDALTVELAEVSAKLVTAETKATAHELMLSEVAPRLKVLEEQRATDDAAKAQAKVDAFISLALSEGKIPKGSEDKWRKLYSVDSEATEGALGLMPAHAHAPKPGAVGLSGTNEVDLSEAARVDAEVASAKEFQALELSEGRRVDFAGALEHVQKGAK